MTKRVLWHKRVYWFALLGIVIGLPLNKIVLSLSGMLLAANWLLEGGFKQKFERLKAQKTGLLLALLFLFLAITTFYSSDLNYALKDLRIKLPLLFCPIVILSSEPLSLKMYRRIIAAFVFSVSTVTIINFALFTISPDVLMDARMMSLFDSHIRLSLMVAAATFLTARTAFEVRGLLKIPFVLLTLWFLFYTHKSEVLTGYFSLFMVALILAIRFIVLQVKRLRPLVLFAVFSGTVAVIYVLYLFVYPIPNEDIDRLNLPQFTELGGVYEHDTTSVVLENGYFIHYFVCAPELDSVWRLRTGEPLIHHENQDLFPSLIRYMTSMGLRKDAQALAQLTDEDIENVQHGFPSIVYAQGGLESRLARITMEIQKHLEGADPNGSTIQQRLEYWRIGAELIRENPVFGVGIGDIQLMFDRKYEDNNSRLHPENRLHTHQQFMTIWIGSGIFGLLIFLFYIVLTFKEAIAYKSYTLLVFWTVITFSYFFEDTLETQVGATLAAFFITFILKQEKTQPLFDKAS